MITEKATIKTDSVHSYDKKKRYSLRPIVRIWKLVPFKVSELITDDVKNDIIGDVGNDI